MLEQKKKVYLNIISHAFPKSIWPENDWLYMLATTIQFMSVRHLIKDGPSCLSVLTVTPIDRLHDGDGSNGVKGAAEEDKLCKL